MSHSCQRRADKATRSRLPHMILVTLLLGANAIQADTVSVLPPQFEIQYEDYFPEPIEPEGHYTLRGFHCSFRKEKGRKSERFKIYIEKDDRHRRLTYGTRWRSVGLNDVISIEGKRYELAKISDGYTRLLFKSQGQTTEGQTTEGQTEGGQTTERGKANIICVPSTGETVIGRSAVVVESGGDPDRIVVVPLSLSDAQVRRPNNRWLPRVPFTFEQRYSKRAFDAARVEINLGGELSVEDQRYTMVRIVKPEPEKGVVGWIEIARSISPDD